MKSSGMRFFVVLLMISLWGARLKGAITWPWPVVVVITIICLAILAIGKWRAATSPQVSRETAAQTLAQSNTQHLRCLTFLLPAHWRTEKIESGAFRMYIKELLDLAWINVDVDWLWKTKIDSVEAYREYAVEFVTETLKCRLLRNEITARWGVPAHEFEWTGKHSTGRKITIPYHGTEYGLQVSAKFAGTFPAATTFFEEFLALTKFDPPPLEGHTAFNGMLSIGLPPGFRSVEDTADSALWKTSAGRNVSISVRRLPLPPEVPLTAEALQPLAADRPNPGSPFHAGPFAMKDMGISGFQSYQATDPGAQGRDWFVAALELATGGRYLFVFNAHTRTEEQTFYLEHFRHVPICMEIIASMSEEGTFGF
jgi:hypothetical protein